MKIPFKSRNNKNLKKYAYGDSFDNGSKPIVASSQYPDNGGNQWLKNEAKFTPPTDSGDANSLDGLQLENNNQQSSYSDKQVFGNEVFDNNSTSSTNKEINKNISGTGTYGALYGAVRGMVQPIIDKGRSTQVNAQTGQKTDYYSDSNEAVKSKAFTPLHETVVDDMGKGNYLRAFADLSSGGLSSNWEAREENETAKRKATETRKSNEMYLNSISRNTAIDKFKLSKSQGFSDVGNKYATMFKEGGYINKFLPKYKFGGILKKYPKGSDLNNPEYEVENNEVVQGSNVELQNQENLSSDMTKAVGATHENGGIEGKGGERVFSDRLPVSPILQSLLSGKGFKIKPNTTYAETAIQLGKLKGKFEIKIKSPDPITNETGKVMLGKIDDAINSTFEDQENMKALPGIKGKFAKGGLLPKKKFGDTLKKVDNNVDLAQVANAGVTAYNITQVDKQKTHINRKTALPSYTKSPDLYSLAKYDINKTTNTLGKSLDRVGNVQDNFSRKAILHSQAINEVNKAAQSQAQLDAGVNSVNTQISNNYGTTLANNSNLDELDRVAGENQILVNKQNALNTGLIGVMGNIGSRRAYNVDKEKMKIAAFDSGRGTSFRSNAELGFAISDKDKTQADEILNNPNSTYSDKIAARKIRGYAKGGKIKRGSLMSKSYC